MPYIPYRDIDGAYTATRYAPAWEANERRRWEQEHGEPWDRPAAEIMEDELPHGTVITNHGCGPAWSDLCLSGYFDQQLEDLS